MERRVRRAERRPRSGNRAPEWRLRRSAPARAPRSRRPRAFGAGAASTRTPARRSARRALRAGPQTRAARDAPPPTPLQLVPRRGRVAVARGGERPPLAVEPVERRLVQPVPGELVHDEDSPRRKEPGDPVESGVEIADVMEGEAGNDPVEPFGVLDVLELQRAGRARPAGRADRSRARRSPQRRAQSSARPARSRRRAPVPAAAAGVRARTRGT